MADNKRVVTGEILFGKDAKAATGITIYIRLEDVSRSDDSSKVIAEQRIENASFQADQQIQFKIDIRDDVVDEAASYSLRVHVDVDGDGQVSRGDYVSTASHPVLTFGYPSHVAIPVRQV